MINFEALSKISYGLYIVSSGEKDKGNGFISNSVFQVTADPAQFAVCCNKDNLTADIIKQKCSFSISVLEKDTPLAFIGKFGYKSGRDINKMDGTEYEAGETGVPLILNNTIAIIECLLKKTIDVGTHLIFIGEVVQAKILKEAEPLTYSYYRDVKKGVAPKNAPTYVDKSKLTANRKISSEKYKCSVCGYIYDSEKGDEKSDIKPGTSFDELPDDWVCPVCGAEKNDFFMRNN